MGTIITAATIMATYVSAINDANTPYFYNAEIENDQIKTMYVLENDGETLQQKIEYDYKYDAQGRLTCKEAKRFNVVSGKFVPDFKLNYTYTTDGYYMERCNWNESKNDYDAATDRIEYKNESENIIGIVNYEWNDRLSKMIVKDTMLLMV